MTIGYTLSCSKAKSRGGNGDSIDDSVEEKRESSAVEKTILEKIQKKVDWYNSKTKKQGKDAMFVVMRNELYGGLWGNMKKDIKNRAKGKPYIFRLVNQTKYDLKRIERLQRLEKKYGNLNKYLLPK